MPKLLVLFETSGCVSIPFREAGWEVLTIDILPHKKNNNNHIIFDLNKDLKLLKIDFTAYDLLIAFPPCTYFSKAGLYLLNKQQGRKEKQLKDLELIKKLWELPIKHKCFENPGGSALNKLWKKANCIIDYCEYADFKKKECLWLENLPPLLPAQYNIKKYGNLITRLSGYKRSITPIEVGYAMLNQWGYLFKK